MRSSNFVKIATTGTVSDQSRWRVWTFQMILLFPPTCSLKNFCSNPNNGRDTFGVKQNLRILLVAPYQRRIKYTILHGFGPLLRSLLIFPVRNREHPEVPARPLPRNQGNRGIWTVGYSWKKTLHTHYGSLATAPESMIWSDMSKCGTFEVGLICWWGTIRVVYGAKLISYLGINWILVCIAYPLQHRGFASIRSSDNKDAEVRILGS